MTLRQRLAVLCSTGGNSRNWHKRLAFSGWGAIQYLGHGGLIAIGTLALCSIIWATSLVDLEEQTDLLDVQRLSDRKAVAADHKPPQERVSELAAYRDVLTDQSRLAILIGQLHGLAEKAGLRLTASEFSVPDNGGIKNPPAPAIVVMLESTASHDAVIKFINLVLASMPNAALEAISMNRAKLADPAWETQMRFRFYVKTT